MGLFYRPVWRDFSLDLDEYAIDCFESSLGKGQTLDDSINRALGAPMYRIRFPIRVQKAEKAIRRLQESPEDLAELTERQRQEIEILYDRPVEEVASFGVPFKPVDQPGSKRDPQYPQPQRT